MAEEQKNPEYEEAIATEGAIMDRLKKNPDFRWFYDHVVVGNLEILKNKPFGIDLNSEKGRQDAVAAIAAYMVTYNTFVSIFDFYENEMKRLAED